ncbi:Hypothetical protein Ccan_07790 [Capnocytophaga canimorsus Cc5]|uniref:Transposase IS30-like HTH domain-containing protein n=1 Tax=Capnocytophaga canimorsus (strain 5) TaxID=860228 RepID=F9YTW3_CAPCC|nr:Hypothetical protein Ccan_07790 [Capnocytophaga canimorsus Cc5]
MVSAIFWDCFSLSFFFGLAQRKRGKVKKLSPFKKMLFLYQKTNKTMKYRYLTSEQRYIKAYPKCNKSQKIIAQQLGVSESTISMYIITF